MNDPFQAYRELEIQRDIAIASRKTKDAIDYLTALHGSMPTVEDLFNFTARHKITLV